MNTYEARNQAIFSAPVMGPDGVWGSLGGVSIRASLAAGRKIDVVSLLETMEVPELVKSISEAGHKISRELQLQGKQMLISDFCNAAFAAKNISEMQEPTVLSQLSDALDTIRLVLSESKLSVNVEGDLPSKDRPSLMMIARQGIESGIQGFAFEGILGKFQVSMSMADVVELHANAVGRYAEDSVRLALGVWVDGDKVANLPKSISDSVQRLLHGSVSLAAASVIVNAIKDGSVHLHASTIGRHEYSRLLMDQGYDINAETIETQANNLGLTLATPDYERGQYFGPVVALDHRAGLIKFSRQSAVELPFSSLPDDSKTLLLGERVRLNFCQEKISIGFADRIVRDLNQR